MSAAEEYEYPKVYIVIQGSLDGPHEVCAVFDELYKAEDFIYNNEGEASSGRWLDWEEWRVG